MQHNTIDCTGIQHNTLQENVLWKQSYPVADKNAPQHNRMYYENTLEYNVTHYKRMYKDKTIEILPSQQRKCKIIQ